MAYTEHNDWSDDAHSGNDEAHYRLYVGRDGKPTTICVQWFDYFHYDARRILSPDAWETEAYAEQALVNLQPTIDLVARELSPNLDVEVYARALAERVRGRIGAENTVARHVPQVNYLHVVLSPADIDWIKGGGQHRIDIEHETGDGPPVRVAVVYLPKADRDTSFYQ